MKTQGQDTHREPETSQAEGEATGLVIEPERDQETIAVLAYYYWEARGRPNDSPQEDWFRAKAELRSRLAAAATA
jgi:hypothetical protein